MSALAVAWVPRWPGKAIDMGAKHAAGQLQIDGCLPFPRYATYQHHDFWSLGP